METEAKYVAVGAFVLTCTMAIVVAIIWIAGLQYYEEYSYYQIYFKGPVTGLGKGTFARYNGIEVGRISALAFDPNDPQSVVVTLELQRNLKIHEDSVATIESQGLVGGTYVEISGGTKTSPLLATAPGQEYPVIRARRSPLQLLEQSAPQLVARLNVTAERLNDLLNEKNRRGISDILVNLDDITTTLSNRSAELDEIIRHTDQATDKLDDALDTVKPTIKDAQIMLNKYSKVADDADTLINGDAFTQLPILIRQSSQMVTSITKLSDQISNSPTALLFGDRRKGYVPK